MPDRLGRRTFQSRTQIPISTRQVTPREQCWLEFLNIHKYASSTYLYENTRATHRCPQTAKRMLRHLFDAGLVYKPEQQRNVATARYNDHIYALTVAGEEHLKDTSVWKDCLKLTGPWVHQYMVACITASIHILCERAGLAFVPGHEITQSLAVDVPFKWGSRVQKHKLIPDSLFAIKYPTGFIAYALEADRSTETIDPSSPYRKSVRRNVKQYAEFVGHKQYKKDYGLDCPLVVLNVAVSTTHIQRALQIVDEEIGACNYMAYGLAPMFKTPFQPPKQLLSNFFTEPLLRNGWPSLKLDLQQK